MINKELLLEKPPLGKRFVAYFLDLLLVLVSTIALYFVVLYAVFGAGFNYIFNQYYVNERYEEYGLNIPYETNYEPFEKVLQKFYFDEFKDEIIEDFKKDGKDYSIEYIYNVVVLGLPEKPTPTNYDNSLYHYVQNSDGTYNVNVLGVKSEGSGEFYERSMADLFYAAYEDLPNLLSKYDEQFAKSLSENSIYEMISRVISLFITSTVFFIVVPLINKNGSTLFEKQKKIGYVNKKDYFALKSRKVPLRRLILFIFPLLGMAFFNGYTFVILVILPVFLDPLAVILSKRNANFFELICSATCCDLELTEIFKNEEEFEKFSNEEKISDKNYLNNLKNVDSIAVNEGENNEKK